MTRRIPDRLLPHRVSFAAYLGAGASGRRWGPWGSEQRALVEGMRTVSLSPLGDEVQATSRAFVDLQDLPVGSRMRHDGTTYLVASVRPFEHPRVGGYLELALSESLEEDA